MRSTLLKSRFQVAGGECARLCSRLRRHLCVLAMGDGSPVSREEDYFYTAQGLTSLLVASLPHHVVGDEAGRKEGVERCVRALLTTVQALRALVGKSTSGEAAAEAAKAALVLDSAVLARITQGIARIVGGLHSSSQALQGPAPPPPPVRTARP